MRISVTDIAEWTAGTCVVPADPAAREATGLTWDSRTVAPGDAYVALAGERVDGHTFCRQAFEAGAACALVEKDVDWETQDAAKACGAGIVRVPSTMQAVRDLAAAWRDAIPGTVIAITGSSGKTTTKNLVRDVLSSAMPTIATLANQNNELGVPATLLRAQMDTKAVVVEMGMRGLGQLQDLGTFVKPDMALVTNVGSSHIELLGSRDAIAHAKAEALAAVKDGGWVFVNASDDFARELLEYSHARSRDVRVVLFDGSGADPQTYPADLQPSVYASAIDVAEDGCPAFVLHTPDGSAHCHLQVRGIHNVHNAASAAAIAFALGMEPLAIARALETGQSETGRQNIVTTADGVVIIDDAYNANPESMRASLSMFKQMDVAGRRIAILGDMGELGDFAPQAHYDTGALVAQVQPDLLVCVGSLSQGIAQGAVEAGLPEAAILTVPDAESALKAVAGTLRERDAVLIKASHAMRLDTVVKGLTTSC